MTKRENFLILFGVLAFFLFNYPLLQIFNRDLHIGGIPLLILYFFVVWLLIILVLLVGKVWLLSKD